MIRKGDKVKFFNTGKEYDADEVGVLHRIINSSLYSLTNVQLVQFAICHIRINPVAYLVMPLIFICRFLLC